jgi:hypothetical protein
MSTSKVIEYKDGNLDVKLTIVKSTVRIGMMRTLMIEKAKIPDRSDGQEALAQEADFFVSAFLYPSLVCAVGEQAGFDHWPITADEFMELPEMLEYEWEKATFELNPHWRPKIPETKPEIEQAKKKVIVTT